MILTASAEPERRTNEPSFTPDVPDTTVWLPYSAFDETVRLEVVVVRVLPFDALESAYLRDDFL